MAKQTSRIPDELLAAFMDGNTTLEETQRVLDAAASDQELQELLQFSMQVDEDMETPALFILPTASSCLPVLERAAQNTVDNLCAIRCEGFALRTLGIDVSDEALEREAKKNHWLHEDGMPLHLIGWSSGIYGSHVTRKYDCSLNDIAKALKKDNVVIVVIDNTELKLTPQEAREKDLESGKLPNHAVVITSMDLKKKTIDIFNPGFPDLSKTYPLDIFNEAWNDSANYLVIISNHSNYDPQPLNLDDVKLESKLTELCEVFAENAHEMWAKMRKAEGWTYGPTRDDIKKHHPNILPYHLLPESEKRYARQMATNTIKLLKKLGWDLVKRK